MKTALELDTGQRAFVRAMPLEPAEADLADDALLALFRLRDALVVRNANRSACRVEEIMTALEDFARGRGEHG